jgi:chemotaxis signal transduction protein
MNGVHVRVAIGGEQYALPVEHVHEVVEVGDLTPVPGAADSMLGLRNLSGEIVPTLDLASLLHVEHDGRAERLVVVEHDGRRTAFAVDEVVDVGPLAGADDEHESPNLLASTVIDGTMVGVLAVDVLLESISQELSQ